MNDIPDNWRDDPLENTPPVRSRSFLADQGYADPDETRVKFLLVGRLRAVVERQGLRQIDLVRLAREFDESMTISQPDVSKVLRGNVKGWSVWRLMRLLNAVGDDIKLVTCPSKGERATVSVLAHEDLEAC